MLDACCDRVCLLYTSPDAAKLTYFGLHSLQHRGQEGAGILSNDAGQLKRYRDTGLLSEVFRNPANLDKLTGTGAIGHVRYATAGEASVDNIQPFLFRFHDTQFGLAHNGNLTNAKSLKRELENNGGKAGCYPPKLPQLSHSEHVQSLPSLLTYPS